MQRPLCYCNTFASQKFCKIQLLQMKSPLSAFFPGLTVSIIIMVSLFACNTQKPPAGPEVVRDLVTKFHDGLRNNDTVELKAVTTNDFRLAEDSMIYHTEDIIHDLRSMPAYTAKFEFSDYTAIVDQQTAVLTYNKKLTLTIADSTIVTHRFESAFAVKEKNEWKLFLLNSMPKK